MSGRDRDVRRRGMPRNVPYVSVEPPSRAHRLSRPPTWGGLRTGEATCRFIPVVLAGLSLMTSVRVALAMSGLLGCGARPSLLAIAK